MQELREKIINTIKENGVYNGKSMHQDYYVINDEELADALIAAGIGDVTEWKEKVECAKRILQIPTLPNGTTDLSYFEYKGERIQDIARQRDEYKHRAEVAERALSNACRNIIADEKDGIEIEPRDEVLYKAYLKQAENELKEGKKE